MGRFTKAAILMARKTGTANSYGQTGVAMLEAFWTMRFQGKANAYGRVMSLEKVLELTKDNGRRG